MATEPLYLTVLRQENTIAVDLTEVAPVVPRGWLQIEESLLTEIGEELARITALANKRATLSASGVAARLEPATGAHRDVQRLGELIFSHLLPDSVQQRLVQLPLADLFLRLDDQLVHVPWELAFDGRDFLFTKFRVGRQVISHQRPRSDYVALPQHTDPLKMLIITDPTETLPAVVEECEQLCSLLSACDHLDVSVMGGKHLRKIDLLQALNDHDLVHYAGHAYFDPTQPGDSGWVLHNAVLTAAEISRLSRPPFLVFANACQAGATTRWQSGAVYDGQAFGIGSAFLLAGTPNYIGTFCVIHDTHSAAFAADFYHHLLRGERLGVALAAARRRAYESSQSSGLLWASYVHYGNPTFHLPLASVSTEAASEGVSCTIAKHAPEPIGLTEADASVTLQRGMDAGILPSALPSPAAEAPPQATVPDESQASERRKRRLRLAVSVCIVLALGLVTAFWAAHSRGSPELAGPLLAQANSTLAQGHLFYSQGRLDEALVPYRHITEKLHSAPWQQAMAYNRLGQIYTAQGNVAKALECYDKAISQHRDMALAHTNKAYLLEQLGRRQEALVSYRQALQLNPDDALTATLFREAQRRAQLTLDKEKQERIDRLVTELLQTHREGRQLSSLRDDWTSPPLTLAFMDMQIQGTPSPRAGEPEFFWLRLTQTMRTHERLQLVEREVMDKLLAELKLSAAALTESQTALQVGKLLAARLIAMSTFRRSGETGQIGVRLIETETGRIQAMVTETFETSETLDRAVVQLSHTLLTQMRQRHPLQGRIARLTSEAVILDIGTAQGVTPGVTLQVFGSEEPIERNGKVVDYHRIPVGLVEVTSVAVQFAQARVLEQNAAFQAGWKVQEVREQ